MKKILCFLMHLFSIQVFAQDAHSIRSLDSPATKFDILTSSLIAQLGCEARYSVWPEPSLSNRNPELCMSDLDYLVNTKTLRMIFVVSENHHLVAGFDELEDKDKMNTVSEISTKIEAGIIDTIKNISLLIGINPINMEFSFSHKGFSALRNRKGEFNTTRYEVKGL